MIRRLSLSIERNQEIKRINPDCRFKHIKLHTPVASKRRCQDCEDWIEVEGRNLCSCCHHILSPTKNNENLLDVLNEGRRIYHKEIHMWGICPTPKHPHLIICFRGVYYEIPIKYMVLSQEPINKANMLSIVRDKTVVKGLGFSADKEREYEKVREKIWKHYDQIPHTEETDLNKIHNSLK
jgi:hypothetical protein